jgi:hypothetical protein
MIPRIHETIDVLVYPTLRLIIGKVMFSKELDREHCDGLGSIDAAEPTVRGSFVSFVQANTARPGGKEVPGHPAAPTQKHLLPSNNVLAFEMLLKRPFQFEGK